VADQGKSLVYFGHMPAEGTGSPIIVYRHLRRLSDSGWSIHVVPEWGQDAEICRKHGWKVFTLTHRKPFWPPYHPDHGISRAIRAWLWAGEVMNWLGSRPDATLTYLSAFSDALSIVAAGFSRRYLVPLTTIHHDDTRCFCKEVKVGERAHLRHQWILQNSSKTLFASRALAECFDLSEDAIRVLAPIPEGWNEPAGWETREGKPLRIYYAGALWPAQFPLLSRVARALDAAGGRLVILSRETPELRDFADRDPVEWMEPFPSNREALEHLVSNATAMLASYSERIEDMPWVETSFPSKFVEFSHLGIPCAIVAPKESAIAQWAIRESFPNFFLPDQLDSFGRWAVSLAGQKDWQAAADALLKHARGEFSPDVIQRRLEDALRG
jgi:hypothetical protein